jgi:glycine cleavage system H protein
MANSDVRDGYEYTKDHEWLLAEGDTAKIGITAFAVEQLGDITLVNIDVKVGDSITAGKAFGTVESVKTLSDLFAPLSGEVTAVNEALNDAPELVNEDPFGKAWMITVRPAAKAEGTLDAAAYRAFLATAG